MTLESELAPSDSSAQNSKSLREQAVREAKCGLILDAALKVFSEKGLHEARLEDIAAAAGFSKGSLYNYFTDKEDIFLQLTIREHERLLGRLRDVSKVSSSLRENLEDILGATIEHFGDRFAFFVTAFNFRAASPAMIGNLCKYHGSEVSRFRELNKSILALVADLFEAARKRGEIRSSVSDSTLARYVASLVRGTFMDWKINGAMEDIEPTIRDLVEFTLRGVDAQ